MIHELKTDPEVFQMSKLGRKDWEIRYNDRDFKIGDELHLRETVHSGEQIANGESLEYTGRMLVRQIVGIIDGYGLEKDWVILSVIKV